MLMRLLKRLFTFVVMAELLYLLLVNVALSIPFTQTIINKIKPEKFQITWEKAWTPYPLKVYIEGVSAWGTSSQKWKVDVHQASARVSLLPLLNHRVKVYDIDAVNVDYAQRPVTVDSKKEKFEPYFAPLASLPSSSSDLKKSEEIEGKKGTAKKEKKAWKIDLENIVAKGTHSFWIYQAKGKFSGDVFVEKLSIETKSGPFSVENGNIDVFMEALALGEKQDVLTQSKIKGRVDFAPIVFSKNKGVKMLSFLSVDANIKSHMGNLDLLNVYLARLNETSIKGKGLLDGHIVFEKGVLLPKTEVKIEADALALKVKEYGVEGDGEIALKITDEKPKDLQASVNFDSLQAYVLDEKKESELFSGKGLILKANVSPQLFPIPPKEEILTSASMDIPTVKVKNIALFQRYVPKKWAFELEEGSGELHAKALMEDKHAFFDLQLLSKDAKVSFSKRSFQGDLDLVVKFDAKIEKREVIKTFEADMSGSYISLTNAVLANHKQESKKWDSHLNIEESTFSLALPKEIKTITMDHLDVKEMLSASDGHLKVSGVISQFDWLNLLLKNSLNLKFEGSGEIEADLELKKGLLKEGSKISIVPKDLQLSLLDYQFMGDGDFHFSVIEGGETPSLLFNIALKDAKMKRHNEKKAMIEHVSATLEGEVKDLDLEKAQKDVDLHLKIASAKVMNMSVYNTYIPKNSPFSLTKGTANMQADLLLNSNNAKGYVKLKTDGLSMKANDQEISARLTMDIKVNSGVPSNMAFNIAGSSIVLDQARVDGSTSNYKKSDWFAKVALKKADVVWRKPIKLSSETTLQIKDSRPIVAMLDNQKEKHNWLSNLMTIQDIKGTATVNMAKNVISFPYAFVKSDKIDIGAKGIISSTLREGMFYLRYKKLKLLLKTKNGKKNIDIFHVKKTFGDYVIPIK